MNRYKTEVTLLLMVVVLLSTTWFNPQSVVAVNQGYYYTKGSQILDSSGKPVEWNGLNWFGFETSNFAPHGLWTRNMEDMLDQAKEQGYNLIRLPYSNQMFDKTSKANGIDYSKNAGLKNKTPLEIMDYLIAKAGERDFKIILDRHRPDAEGQSELWYTSAYSEKRWIDDWVMLAERYKGNKIVIGADLHNEPHGKASWGTGDKPTDWRLAAQRAGNAILKANQDWLIIVEGVSSNVKDASGDYWWGGNLQGVAKYPVTLNVPNRLVYSAHDYGPGVYHQTWFNASNFPNNLPAIWDKYWGYISKQGIAPVLVGEFGGRAVDTKSLEGKWQRKLVSYIKENKLYWTYWSLNPNSGDTGGLLLDDWKTWNKDKQEMLQPIMSDSLSQAQAPSKTNVQQNTNLTEQSSTAANHSNLTGSGHQHASSTAQAQQNSRSNKVKLLYFSKESSEQDNSIRVGLKLENISDRSIDLKQITMRYWYTRDSSDDVKQQFHVDYAALGNKMIIGKFVALEAGRKGADAYVEIGFEASSGSLQHGKSTGEIKIRFHKQDWSSYDLTNDYSYTKNAISYKKWSRITVYENGKLIYGVEPAVK